MRRISLVFVLSLLLAAVCFQACSKVYLDENDTPESVMSRNEHDPAIVGWWVSLEISTSGDYESRDWIHLTDKGGNYNSMWVTVPASISSPSEIPSVNGNYVSRDGVSFFLWNMMELWYTKDGILFSVPNARSLFSFVKSESYMASAFQVRYKLSGDGQVLTISGREESVFMRYSGQ